MPGSCSSGRRRKPIKAMGNKAGAKEIMQAAGVPCVPGYQGADQSDAVMLAEAGKIGFPVMIKAVAGGGGRGMRLVADAAAFPDALRSARSEAQGAFGDPTVILERAIADPRHIEIQVFGDRHGNAIHLGERDCSVQRRHQKLIEEAPSPAVSPELRARMGAVAVAAVKSIGYEGAGTLEFLLDRSGEFYFMEMNTRLQVEHPVTEAITGLDLVELQLRVAGGEPLGLRQEDIKFSGHAIEVRLCSEDAGHDFMPQSGRMALWQMPGRHPRRARAAIRLRDSAVLRFDDRQADQPWREPRRGAAAAHSRPRTDRRVRRHHQSGVSRRLPARIRPLRRARRPRRSSASIATSCWRRAPTPLAEAALAAVLLYVTDPFAPPWRSGRSLAATFPVPVRVELDHGIHELEVGRERDGGYVASLENTLYRIEIDELDGDTIRFRSNGLMESAKFLRDGDRLFLLHRGSHARRSAI